MDKIKHVLRTKCNNWGTEELLNTKSIEILKCYGLWKCWASRLLLSLSDSRRRFNKLAYINN